MCGESTDERVGSDDKEVSICVYPRGGEDTEGSIHRDKQLARVLGATFCSPHPSRPMSSLIEPSAQATRRVPQAPYIARSLES